MIGTYTDINDGSTLEIGNSTNSGLSVKINLFRLTDIDDGIGLISDGVLIFNATDAAGNPIKGKITLDSDTATLVFTESTWEYLPNGTSYSFIRGAGPIMDRPILLVVEPIAGSAMAADWQQVSQSNSTRPGRVNVPPIFIRHLQNRSRPTVLIQ